MSLRDQTQRAAALRALRDLFGDQLSEEQSGPLAAAMIANYEASGGGTVNIELGEGDDVLKAGTVTLPKAGDSIDVVDSTYAKWVAANYPGEVTMVLTVNPAFASKHKKEVIGDFKTGDVYDKTLAAANGGEAVKVEGMTARKGQGYGTPQVKLTKEGRQAILNLLGGSTILELQAAPAEPAAAADPDIVDGEVVEDDDAVHAATASPTTFVAPYSRKQLDAMKRTVGERNLVGICKEYGISHTGSVAELRARILERQAEEVAPGVQFYEAFSAAMHAIHVQGGATTWQIEADRLAADRDPSLRARQQHANEVGDRLLQTAKEQSQ